MTGDLFGFQNKTQCAENPGSFAAISAVVSSAPDVLLLLGMLMLGMALGALLTHIRHKAQTARIVQELEAKFGVTVESEKHDSTKPNAAA